MEQALLQAGWSPDQVRKALKAYVDVDFPIPVPRPLPSATTRDAWSLIPWTRHGAPPPATSASAGRFRR
jgi:hypothetical protein